MPLGPGAPRIVNGSHAPRARPLASGSVAPVRIVRELGPWTLVLRLPEGECLELNEAADAVFRAASAGFSPRAIADALARDTGLEPRRTLEHVRALLEVCVAGPEQIEVRSGFAPPLLDPPAECPELRLATLPPRQHWLLLVAASASLPRAEQSYGEWEETRTGRPCAAARRILPLVAANLASQGSATIVGKGLAYARRAWIDTERSLHNLGDLLRRFDREGIPVAFLKGVAAALVDYRDTALRPMVDFDLLVPYASRHRAASILVDEGFDAIEPKPDPRFAHLDHGAPYLRDDRLSVDLHWHALWTNCWEGADDELWKRAERSERFGAPYSLPDPATRLIVACVHGLRADSGGPPHAWAADAVMLLAAHGGALDWDHLVAEARARRVTRYVREALHFLASSLGAPVPGEVLASLARLRGGMFEDAIFRRDQFAPSESPSIATVIVDVASLFRTTNRRMSPREVREFLECYRVKRGFPTVASLLARVTRNAIRHAAADLRSRARASRGGGRP